VHPAFATVQFGPFETAYHRKAVDAEFREALSTYLEKELLPQVDEPFESTEGTLKAVFNEEKYCGPNSAVKDTYELEFSFLRSSGADCIRVQISRDQKSGSFRPRYPGRPMYLWTAARKQRQLTVREEIDDMVARILNGERGEWKCPQCGDLLRLVDSDHVFDLTCLRGCFTYEYHRDPVTRKFMHGHFFSNPQ
jgi:hypothetical protein